MPTTITVKISRCRLTCPIIIGPGLLNNPTAIIPSEFRAARLAIITDTFVKKMYGLALEKNFRAKGYRVDLLTFPAGEQSKNQATVTALQHQLLKKKFGRDTLILALGGGIAGDMAGFVAATFLRSVPYIQIPTTLLAMVDSSIGGKVGIDTPYGKNTIGAFYQPEHVAMDTELIVSLSKIQLINGLLEAIKSFFTSDAPGLKLVNKLDLDNPKRTQKILEQIITRSVRFKAGVAERDEKEENERRVLNFGHTIGHALETLSNYTLPHGYAVGYGMLVEAKISELLGILSSPDYHFVETYLNRFGINRAIFQKYPTADIVAATKLDKKVRGGRPYYVLLEKIGQVYTKGGQFAHVVPDTVVKKALNII